MELKDEMNWWCLKMNQKMEQKDRTKILNIMLKEWTKLKTNDLGIQVSSKGQIADLKVKD